MNTLQIILSPAKKMKVNTDVFDCHGLPQFLPQTEQLLQRLRSMSYEELKTLWKCNDQIAGLNWERLQTMDLRRNLTPALLSYEGIQYQYMAPGVFTAEQLAYVEAYLRILSGFYGLLRPFDGVTPYRLEMGAKLNICEAKDLYSYWGDRLAESLFAETDCVVNLASKEYSQCVSRHLREGKRLITCIFGERKGSSIVEKGTLCKMARGEMVRYMAEERVEDPERLKAFDRLGYRFAREESGEDVFVFLKQNEQKEDAS